MWEWTAIRNFIWKFDSLWNSDDDLILASTARECWILYSAFAWSRFAIIVVLKVSTTDAGTVFEHFNNYFQTSWVPLERLCWYVLFWIGGIHTCRPADHTSQRRVWWNYPRKQPIYISARNGEHENRVRACQTSLVDFRCDRVTFGKYLGRWKSQSAASIWLIVFPSFSIAIWKWTRVRPFKYWKN